MSGDAHALDVERLSQYLERHLEGFQGPLTARKFPGGQSNPTFLLTARSGEYVLRRQPPGPLLKSAHAVDREYRVLKALSRTAVPVPRPYHLCEDREVIGSLFYVMARVKGRVFWDPALPEVARSSRAAYHEALVDNLAALHAVDVDAAGLADYGRAGNYFERQIAVWTKQYRASQTDHHAGMERLIAWLPANCVADEGPPSLVHGDYRIDNLIFDAQGPKLLATLDWELSTLGNGLADLAYLCMCLRLPPDAPIRGLAGEDRAALGIPDEAALVARYCALRGMPGVPHWSFYLAFSYFRLAAILQGVKRRAQEGNASARNAPEMGAMAYTLADAGASLTIDATP